MRNYTRLLGWPLLAAALQVHATPRIVTATPRAVHGDEVTLGGCDFGAHSLDI